jgi:hypothetical protein
MANKAPAENALRNCGSSAIHEVLSLVRFFRIGS